MAESSQAQEDLALPRFCAQPNISKRGTIFWIRGCGIRTGEYFLYRYFLFTWKALLLKSQGNDAFTLKDYEKALDLFTQAIELCRTDYTFYSNRSGFCLGVGSLLFIPFFVHADASRI